MFKSNNKPFFKNKYVLLIFGLIIVGMLLLTCRTYFFKSNTSGDTDTKSTIEQNKQEADTNASEKKKFIEQQNNQSLSDNNRVSAGSVKVTATQEKNGTITIITKISSFDASSCSLSITNGTKSFKQTADAIYQTEYSSCAGFSVPISSLGPGSWSIKVDANNLSEKLSGSTIVEVK